MILFILLYTCVILILSTIFIIYWRVIRPERRVYALLRYQGVCGEPFVPIIGQMPAIRRARENDALMNYHEALVQKHGYVYLVGYGPLTRLVVLRTGYVSGCTWSIKCSQL